MFPVRLVGVSSIAWISAGDAARWRDDDMMDLLTAEAAKFMEAHRSRPFSLWFAPIRSMCRGCRPSASESKARWAARGLAGAFGRSKYSIYNGGLRAPLIVRWPNMVQAGCTSDALIDHVDLIASFAVLVGQPLPHAAAVDSQDMLAPLLGRTPAGRTFAS